jgi:hypothetical protein
LGVLLSPPPPPPSPPPPPPPPTRPLATARDGVTTMAVVKAARRSAELEGAEVTVAPLQEVSL